MELGLSNDEMKYGLEEFGDDSDPIDGPAEGIWLSGMMKKKMNDQDEQRSINKKKSES